MDARAENDWPTIIQGGMGVQDSLHSPGLDAADLGVSTTF
jgi:hypothetical protein